MLAVPSPGLARDSQDSVGAFPVSTLVDRRSLLTGCMVLFSMILIAGVGLAYLAGPVVGLVILILSMVILALAIALFRICMTIRMY